MTDARYDVIGIGNAIVDIIGRCDEAMLADVGVAKGSMRLVDADEIKKTIVNSIAEATNEQAKSLGLQVKEIAGLSGDKGKEIDVINKKISEIQDMIKLILESKRKEASVKTRFEASE